MNNFEAVYKKYMEHAYAHCSRRRVCLPDEVFMRAIEECVDIPETMADEFRRTLFISVYKNKAAPAILERAIRKYLEMDPPQVLGKYRRLDDEWRSEW